MSEPPFDESSRPRAAKQPDAVPTPAGRRGQHALVMIHTHLRHELSRVVRAVEAVAAGNLDAGAARSMINESAMRRNYRAAGSFCAQYCQVVEVHHTIEDRHMFVVIGDADPSLRPVLDRLSVEHGIIHGILMGLDRLLVRMVTDAVGAVEVAVEARRLEAALNSHLDYEEAELLEPIGRLSILP
jgi:hemerythrin-like domain-containing protein